MKTVFTLLPGFLWPTMYVKCIVQSSQHVSVLTVRSVLGTMMGNVVSLPVSGLLCQYGFSEGWDSVFYVIGECLLTVF